MLARPALLVQAHGDTKHPGVVHVMVTVEPDARNRLCRVELTGEFHDRASEFPINGIDGPRTSWLDWREVPQGEYLVQAWVVRQGERAPLTAITRMFVP